MLNRRAMGQRVLAATTLTATLLLAQGCSAGGSKKPPAARPTTTTTTSPTATTTAPGAIAVTGTWQLRSLRPVSPIATTSTEVLFTTQAESGRLLSMAVDSRSGRRLWSHDALVQGRFGGMGLAPPTPVANGSGWVAVSVEPSAGATTAAATAGSKGAAVVGRDSRTGNLRWSIPVTATFGAQPCGALVCFDDQHADGSVTLTAVQPDTGRQVWANPVGGQVDLDAGTDGHTLVLRLGSSPVVSDVDPASGRIRWQTAVAPVLGSRVTTDGGWAFRRSDDLVVVELNPYRSSAAATATPSGLVAFDLRSGAVRWKRAGLIFPIETPFVSDSTPQASVASFPLLAEEVETGVDGKSVTTKQIVRLDPATGASQWTVPLGFTYSSAGQVFGAVSSDSHQLWLKDPSAHTLKGIDLASGGAPAATGTVWTQSVGADVSTTKSTDDVYVGPPQLQAISLPSQQPAPAGGRPPAVFSSSAAPGRVWIDQARTIRSVQP